MSTTEENKRLTEAKEHYVPWKKWGPYLSERQWGTVREDYSLYGNAWEYFPHDHARSRAYHWGEDGIAGISDEKQRLCFALAFWNGRDPIIKERLFGLTNSEGNHGEDVKEYYFYLDSTPTHSYMKYLYKYPHAAYPYADLVETNGKRSKKELEYELSDTGVFDENRYFDLFIEYSKESPDELLIKITICNRGPDAAPIHILPTLWFRNTWTWWKEPPKPNLKELGVFEGNRVIEAFHSTLGEYFLYCEGEASLLFTENETNTARIFGQPNATPYVKDGINNYVVHGQNDAINPNRTGTKASAHYLFNVPAGETAVIRLRLSQDHPSKLTTPFGKNFEETFEKRLAEADAFYQSITPPSSTQDEANILRQAFSGMLWGKQYYFFDIDLWCDEHNVNPLSGAGLRNIEWYHMVNDNIISMPDKWEYPWYAAWDLAFHTFILASIDIQFAKEQLTLMLTEHYIHPSGQLPAYEWNFSDVNPPVHAWAVLALLRSDAAQRGEWDVDFLKRAFNKLTLNFTWWVNRKDRNGKNIFGGGFLGLDNIGIFDRSQPLPTGGYIEQADGTAWMALFCQNMMELSIHLTSFDPSYEDMVVKFTEHFFWIALAINRKDGMWDETDGFYYDSIRLPDGSSMPFKIRSIVGLLPLCATTVIEPWQKDIVPHALAFLRTRAKQMPELIAHAHAGAGKGHLGEEERGLIAIVNEERLRKLLTIMLDENEFLSPYGIRALSKRHLDHPFSMNVNGQEFSIGYLPAESDSGVFGGNSNWRGPIWMPINAMIIRALQQYYLYYGDNFKIECPTGSGNLMNLFEVLQEIERRIESIFLRNDEGRRPVYGGNEKFQQDPHWKDLILFYEYFHGDNGAGIGASHQTGWTGIVANIIQLYNTLDPKSFLEEGKMSMYQKVER